MLQLWVKKLSRLKLRFVLSSDIIFNAKATCQIDLVFIHVFFKMNGYNFKGDYSVKIVLPPF